MKKSIASKRGSVYVILLSALATGDKYGYEICKEIEEKSHGTYILKQPSLYSGLKRLEAQKYITSYWKDSDLGGRRHYYKLTDLGKQRFENSNFSWDDEETEVLDNMFEKSELETEIESVKNEVKNLQEENEKTEVESKTIQEILNQTENLVKTEDESISNKSEENDLFSIFNTSYSTEKNEDDFKEEIVVEENLDEESFEEDSSELSNDTENNTEKETKPFENLEKDNLECAEQDLFSVFKTTLSQKEEVVENSEIYEEKPEEIIEEVVEETESLESKDELEDFETKNQTYNFQEELNNLSTVYDEEIKEESFDNTIKDSGIDKNLEIKTSEITEENNEEKDTSSLLNFSFNENENTTDFTDILNNFRTEPEKKVEEFEKSATDVEIFRQNLTGNNFNNFTTFEDTNNSFTYSPVQENSNLNLSSFGFNFEEDNSQNKIEEKHENTYTFSTNSIITEGLNSFENRTENSNYNVADNNICEAINSSLNTSYENTFEQKQNETSISNLTNSSYANDELNLKDIFGDIIKEDKVEEIFDKTSIVEEIKQENEEIKQEIKKEFFKDSYGILSDVAEDNEISHSKVNEYKNSRDINQTLRLDPNFIEQVNQNNKKQEVFEREIIETKTEQSPVNSGFSGIPFDRKYRQQTDLQLHDYNVR